MGSLYLMITNEVPRSGVRTIIRLSYLNSLVRSIVIIICTVLKLTSIHYINVSEEGYFQISFYTEHTIIRSILCN